MTKVSNRDKKTAAKNGVVPSTAASVKRLLSKARNNVEDELKKTTEVNAFQSREEILENLQCFLFGSKEIFLYPTTADDLPYIKAWVEDVASKYFMLYAISLYEACYLEEFNHSTRAGVIRELNAQSNRFTIILKVINECIRMKTSLRRFTADEQNTFMHG
jgi:hypothetical protein